MKQYMLNTRMWTKIWFSSNPNVSIPDRNILRLKELCTKHQNNKFTLVYSSRILNQKGKDHLTYVKQMFAQLAEQGASQLVFVDIDTEDFYSKLKTTEEQQLLVVAKMELSAQTQGGSVAAASDIIRTLSSCYEHGNYTDFDVHLNFESAVLSPQGFELVSVPFAFPINYNRSYRTLSYCNDVLFVAANAEEKDLTFLRKLQNQILSFYEPIKGNNKLKRFTLRCSEEIGSEIEEIIDDIINRKYPGPYPIPLLALRAKILEKMNNPELTETTWNEWRQVYIRTVSQVSGPGAYAQAYENSVLYFLENKGLMFESNNPVTDFFLGDNEEAGIQADSYLCIPSLFKLVQTQIISKKNDGSWMPQKENKTPQVRGANLDFFAGQNNKRSDDPDDLKLQMIPK